MKLGIIMMVHARLDRAEQLARYWVSYGCPVVIHIDNAVEPEIADPFRHSLSDEALIRFCHPYRPEWGTWGMVAAAISAAELMLEAFPDCGNIFLSSGACLPLRPAPDLIEYLQKRPNADFIESVNIMNVGWTLGGLEEERFNYYFPLSWKKQRKWFDRLVRLQRWLGVKRKWPQGLQPHMGSQWWCLTSNTMKKILEDPRREEYDRFFRRSWIPDESYFQSMARLHSEHIESRSLTLSKFDHAGKPHMFYDDHLSLLRRSDCFVARKIWPDANKLYDILLKQRSGEAEQSEPKPVKIDRIFGRALDRRVRGRSGLYMAARFPRNGRGDDISAHAYSVFSGFNELFLDFRQWLSLTTGARVHGHLYAPRKVEFAEGEQNFIGGLSSSARIRDYNPNAFLTNLIWNTRGERQAFMMGPRDNHLIWNTLAADPNAQISVVSGAFLIPLWQSREDFDIQQTRVARLQRRERKFVKLMSENWVRAKIRIWSLNEFLDGPRPKMQAIIDEMAPQIGGRLSRLPEVVDLEGFSDYLQKLRNAGMNP